MSASQTTWPRPSPQDPSGRDAESQGGSWPKDRSLKQTHHIWACALTHSQFREPSWSQGQVPGSGRCCSQRQPLLGRDLPCGSQNLHGTVIWNPPPFPSHVQLPFPAEKHLAGLAPKLSKNSMPSCEWAPSHCGRWRLVPAAKRLQNGTQ